MSVDEGVAGKRSKGTLCICGTTEAYYTSPFSAANLIRTFARERSSASMARDCALFTTAGSGSRWTAFLSFMRRRKRRARPSSAAAEVDWESVATLSTKMYVSQPRPQIQGSTRANLLAQHRGGQAIQAEWPSQRARPAYANHPAPSGLAIVQKGSTAAHCVRPRAYEIL